MSPPVNDITPQEFMCTPDKIMHIQLIAYGTKCHVYRSRLSFVDAAIQHACFTSVCCVPARSILAIECYLKISYFLADIINFLFFITTGFFINKADILHVEGTTMNSYIRMFEKICFFFFLLRVSFIPSLSNLYTNRLAIERNN